MNQALLFIRRALKLRCPECGISPIFVPAKQTKSFDDWFMPLDGCPRCGYAYNREQGYFLLAIWAINYGIVGGVGLIIGLILDIWFHLSLWTIILCAFLPMPFISVLLARHAKALWLALDHYCDPHVTHRPNETPPGS